MDEYKLPLEFEEKVRKAVFAPSAKPEFVNQLRNELARRPVKMKSRFVVRPTWAIASVLAAVVLALNVPGMATALRQLFGYVPDAGLVENSGGIRVLAEPASVTRDGITLTVTQALVYPDHVQLVYEASGLAAENDGTKATDANDNPSAFCAAPDGDAFLRLPDGAIFERVFGSSEYPENVYAMKPAYKASVPADVDELTMVLKCIPWARLGAVPEDWEVSLKLKSIPAGTVVGEPVMDVVPAAEAGEETASQPDTAQPVSSESKVPGATAALEKVVKLGDSYIFYIRMTPREQRPNFLSIMPGDVYVIDSSGQKIALRLNSPFSPYTNDTGLWEYQTMVKLVDGPIKIVVEKAKAYYTAMDQSVTWPTQQMIEDQSFTFDVGPNPQLGQTWAINKAFEISGYKLKVISARAVSWNEYDPSYVGSIVTDRQGYETGYEFTMQSSDPAIQMEGSLSMTLRWSPDVQTPDCGLGDFAIQKGPTFTYTSFCKGVLPKNSLRATFQDISVLIDDVWQMDWTPPVP